MMREEDRFEEYARRTLREVDRPPAPPVEEMWARIRAARDARRDGQGGRGAGSVGVGDARRGAGPTDGPTDVSGAVIPFRPRHRAGRWLRWSAPLAAMLVLGIGIGRISLRDSATPAPDAPRVSSETAPDADAASGAYRFVASQHLRRTEALLASLAVDAGATPVGEVSSWARDLMIDTRLLLTSPAAGDPDMKKLLEDLELVLAQLAAIPAARAAEEVEMIQEDINQSDVLLRLRAAASGPRLAGT